MPGILVLDDDPDLLEVLMAVLTKDGHAVLGASCAESVLAAAREFRPTLAFLDWHVPGVDVSELAVRLRALGCACIVVLTGLASEVPSVAGIDAILEKPVELKRLLALARLHAAPGPELHLV